MQARALPFALPLLFVSLIGCGGDPGGEVEPYPAPAFTLQDLNPSSPTYLDDRHIDEALGGVLVLYFGSFT